MKIAVVGTNIRFPAAVWQELTALGDVSVVDSPPERETILHSCQEAQALITWGRLDRGLLEGLPRLEFVCFLSTGYDECLDPDVTEEYATGRNLTLSYAPDAATDAVAEYTFAATLAALRHLTTPQRIFTQPNASPAQFRALSLAQCRAGIIGMGAIGSRLAWLLDAAGMPVSYYTAQPKKERAIPPRCRHLPLADLVATSHAIAVCCQLNGRTLGMLDRDLFSLMRPDVVLVNAARAEVFVLDDLFAFLRERPAARAVVDELKRLGDHPLLTLPNFYATPHMAFNTAQSLERYPTRAVENLKAYLAGGEYPRVDFNRWSTSEEERR